MTCWKPRGCLVTTTGWRLAFDDVILRPTLSYRGFHCSRRRVLLVDLPAAASASLFFAVSILVVWNSYSDYSKRAMIAHYVSRRCSQITIEFRHIWYDEDTDTTIERIRYLEEELGLATDVELDIDDRLSATTQEETDRVYKEEFGE